MASLMFRAKADNKFYSAESRPKGAGTWYVFHYDLNGKKVRQRIGTNKRTAELAKGDIEARLERQRAGLLDPEEEIRRTGIEEFRAELSDLLRTENKSPRTQTRYCGVFDRFCEFVAEQEPYLKRLDQIDSPLIERYKDHRRAQAISPNGHANSKTRKGVSVRTLNNELTFIHTIFNLAKRRGYIRKNPLEKVSKLSGSKRKQYQPLTREEIGKLLDAADAIFRPILLTFLLTGMRTGELLNLEWTDIDFAKDEILIQPKADWQPKDKESRSVPLHKDLLPVLKELKKTSDSRYVFGHGDQPCANKLLVRLQRTCKRAGVRGITVHNLRDEFASHLVMQGIGIETVSRLLGHSNIQITWNHYVHLAPGRLKEAVETLSWTPGAAE